MIEKTSLWLVKPCFPRPTWKSVRGTVRSEREGIMGNECVGDGRMEGVVMG